jgi:hypothetical protein
MATENNSNPKKADIALIEGNRSVIVIHGVGSSTKRGSLLAKIVNLVADSLLESSIRDDLGPKRAVIEREMDIATNPPTAELRITAPDGETKATWTFKEAFWDDRFPPPAPSAVLRWLFKQGLSQLRNILAGLFKDPANSKTFYDLDELPLPAGEGEGWEARSRDSALYSLQLLVMGAILPPVFAAVLAIAFVFWLFYWVPQVGPMKGYLRWLHVLDPFLSGSLGDAKRYVEHGVWAASARKPLEDIVIGMLEAPYEDTGDITVVAHSLGCLITYDAFRKGGKIATLMADMEEERQRQLDAGQKAVEPRRKITFVSAGSAINQLLPVAQRSNLQAQERFNAGMDPAITGYVRCTDEVPTDARGRFYWLDIHARLDPLPSGPLKQDIVNQANVHPSQVKRRRVLNLENPIRDHSYYWQNRSEVAPRLARAINGGRYPWPEAGITRAKLEGHHRRLEELARWRLVVGAFLVAAMATLGLILAGPWDCLSYWVPVSIALVGVALYGAVRSWKLGDIS